MDKKRLRDARKAKSLTQAELAVMVGTTQQGYNLLENGKQDPKTEMLAKLCSALGVSADYLIGLSLDSPRDDIGNGALTEKERELLVNF